jgi:DNA phosphorothioation-dependent restriction protein DptG
MNQETLKDRIKLLRKQKGVSQTILAKEIEVSYSQYSRYEARGVQPPAETLKRIAEYLETTVDYLLYGNEKAQESLTNSELIKQFKEIEKLPDSEKNVVIKFLNAYIRDYKTQQSYS